MKSCKPNPVIGKMKWPLLVFKMLVSAITLQCTLGLHTCHLPDEGDEYDVISTFNGLSAIQCNLRCATSPEKCDATASEAEGGKVGSCKLLKFASAIVIPLTPPNRLDKRKTKGMITVLKSKIAQIPAAGAWGDWSTWTNDSCYAPCYNLMNERTRSCYSPGTLPSEANCVGENRDLGPPCGTMECVHGDQAHQYCQSRSMSLAAPNFNVAAIQAVADKLPVSDVYYWLEGEQPSGVNAVIMSRPGQPYGAAIYPNSRLYPVACENVTAER